MIIPKAPTLAKYNLSTGCYIDLWSLCGGRCVLCDKPFSSTRPPAIDHDHATGKVRGLLCSQCNYRLGELHENVAWMDNAVRYLRCSPAFHLWGEDVPRVKDAPPVREND